MNNFEPFIKFGNVPNAFVYGCEYGRILEKMERGDISVCNNGMPVRIENKQVLINTCNALGYTYTFGIEKDGWIQFLALKNGSLHN